MTAGALRVTKTSFESTYRYTFDINKCGTIEHCVIEHNLIHKCITLYKIDDDGIPLDTVNHHPPFMISMMSTINIPILVNITNTLADMYGKDAHVVLELIENIYQDSELADRSTEPKVSISFNITDLTSVTGSTKIEDNTCI